VANETLRFDIIAQDRASSGFSAAGRSASEAAGNVDKLSRRLDEISRKSAAARVRLDGNAEALAALDRTDAKLLALDRRVANPNLKVEGAARAIADISAVDAALGKLDDKSSKLSQLQGALKGISPQFSAMGAALAFVPAAATAVGLLGGAAIGLGGAFVAGGGALAAFGAVAKPVLASALTAEQAVQKAQDNYTVAIANGTKQSVAYKAEQVAIGKAYAELSPQQIALSKQLGNMANAWQDLKAAQTPVVAGALQPWLKSVTDLTGQLGPIIAAVSPVIKGLGTQFDALVNSAAFKGFRDFIASTGSKVVGAVGSTLIDFVKSLMTLLPQFNPLILTMTGGIAGLGPAVLKWAGSQKTADGIKSFMAWFYANGPVLTQLLGNIGRTLAMLAPGLGAGGVTELKLVSDFFGLVAKLPPGLAGPIAAVGGALLLLNKAGVFSGGLALVNTIGRIVTGTKEWTAAQALLDIALDANPIGIAVVAIAALGAAFYVAWQKSAGFRDVIKTLGAVVLGMGITVVQGLKVVVDGVLGFFGSIINGAAAAFGWVPGLGPKLKTAAAGFDGFRAGVDGAFNGMIKTMQGWQGQLTAQQKTSTTATAQIVADFTRQGQYATNAKSALDNYTNTVRFNGVTSQAAQQARGQLITDLVNSGVKATTANGDVAAYTTAVANNGIYSDQARAARQRIISDILAASNNSRSGKTDMDALTTAVQKHGLTGDAYRGARLRLITDLVNSGVSGKNAAALVDGLARSITTLPANKPVSISVNGQGAWSIAQGSLQQKLVGYASGGRITAGTTPTADDVLIRASRNETVVSAAHSAQLAPYFAAIGVPGYAAGGVVGGNQLAGQSLWVGRSYDATVAYGINAITKAMTDAINAAVSVARAAAQAATIGTGAVGGSGARYASGSWNIPVTGPAVVHQGEMILPAELAAAVRGAIGSGNGPQPGLAAELRALRGQMAELIRTTAAVPAATGAHVGGAISGAAGAAGFRSRYPAGGA